MSLDKPGGLIHFVPMKPAKAMTIRLSEEQAEALETVATVEQRAVSDVIRAAINEHIESRRKDPSFQEDLKARLARARKLLARQAGSDAD
jgi:predicted DNA-binding protein